MVVGSIGSAGASVKKKIKNKSGDLFKNKMTSATASGKTQGQIISVTRRGDIPAFKGDWFMSQISKGFTNVKTYAGLKRVSLLPDDVACFYFWSKNYQPFMQHLVKLKEVYNCIFCYTITGLPKVFEPNVPNTEACVRNLQDLSKLFSSKQVLWRYDPIITSSVTDYDYHIKRFTYLCQQLSGYTERCIFSYPTYYGKVLDSIKFFSKQTGISINDITLREKQQLSRELADIAKDYNIKLYTCCNDLLISGNVFKSACIDGNLVNNLFNLNVPTGKDQSQRQQCGCSPSFDIGEYNTCSHGCIYCYACVQSNIAGKLKDYLKH